MAKNNDMTEAYHIQIGMQLRMTREAQGWDTKQVATMAGVKAQTVEKIEAGGYRYTFFQSCKLDMYLPMLVKRGYRIAIVDGELR